MDTKRFDSLIASLSQGRSRRTTLRGLAAGVLATFSFVSGADTGEAGNAAKRRRRRRKKEARRRQRCLDACSAPCSFCIHTTAGDIICSDGVAATCTESEFCMSNTDCGGSDCLVATQKMGSADIRRIDCDFPVGICGALLVCSAP